MPYDKKAIYLKLDELFDLEELRTLCFLLDVDYDSLRGEGKSAKARELVRYMSHRTGGLSKLVQAIIDARGADALGDVRAPEGAPEKETSLPPTPSEPTGSQTTIHTGGGAYIGGNVTLSGGDFVGRDKRTGTVDDGD